MLASAAGVFVTRVPVEKLLLVGIAKCDAGSEHDRWKQLNAVELHQPDPLVVTELSPRWCCFLSHFRHIPGAAHIPRPTPLSARSGLG
jgi:hypothetical protein